MAKNIVVLCLVIITVSCMGLGGSTLAEPSADHIESAQVYAVVSTASPTVIPAKIIKPKKNQERA